MDWYYSLTRGNIGLSSHYGESFKQLVWKGGYDVKAFFEEYGLVLVVTVIATGMILFSNDFKETMKDTLDNMWIEMTTEHK